jgi:hypothetical protein
MKSFVIDETMYGGSFGEGESGQVPGVVHKSHMGVLPLDPLAAFASEVVTASHVGKMSLSG